MFLHIIFLINFFPFECFQVHTDVLKLDAYINDVCKSQQRSQVWVAGLVFFNFPF